MRELFYRRDSRDGGGYKVAAKNPGISARDEKYASQKAAPAHMGETPLTTYKQCLLEGGTLMLSCAYVDPHGSRGSEFVHALLSEDETEKRELLRGYPAASGYFDRMREQLSQAQDLPLSQEKTLRVSVSDVMGDDSGNLVAAAALLRETFRDRALLASVIAALLDVASANPRVMAVVLRGMDENALARAGRDLAEALFAFLPDMAAARIGYMSPAANLTDVSFGLRFVGESTPVTGAIAYIVDPDAGSMTCPIGAHPDTNGYADLVAACVADEALGGIHALIPLRDALSDWSIAGSDDIPDDLALRFALEPRSDRLTQEESDKLLAWRHERIRSALENGRPDELTESPFWGKTDAWLSQRWLPAAFNRRAEWQFSRDPDRLRTVFEDGQALFTMGRPEADEIRRAFRQHLKDGEMSLPGSEEKSFAALKHGAESLATDRGEANLYAEALTDWYRDRWMSGAFFGDDEALSAMRAFYQDDPAAWAGCRRAYADYLLRGEKNMSGGTAVFDVDAAKEALSAGRDAFLDGMCREIESGNAFEQKPYLDKVLWYRRIAGADYDVDACLTEMMSKQLTAALEKYDESRAEELAGMLSGDISAGLIGIARRAAPQLAAEGMILTRLKDITTKETAFRLFDRNRTAAKTVALAQDDGKASSVTGDIRALETLESWLKDGADEAALDAYIDLYHRKLNRNDTLLECARRAAARTGNEEKADSLFLRAAIAAYRGGGVDVDELIASCGKNGMGMSQLKAYVRKREDRASVSGSGYLTRLVADRLGSGKKETDALKPYPGDGADTDAAETAGRRIYVAGMLISLCAFAGCAAAVLNMIGLI